MLEIFGHYGKVVNAEIHPVGTLRGSAKVMFDTEKDAEEAMYHLDGGKIDGNEVKVSFASHHTEGRRRPQSPGNFSSKRYPFNQLITHIE